MSLGHLRRTFPEGKVHIHRLALRNRDRFAPDYGIGENGALHSDLSHDVVERALANHSPALVPCNDFVVAGRNLGELEVAIFIGHRIVGMLRYYHFAIHPDMYVAAHAYRAFAGHGTGDLLPLENKGEVVIRAARHLHRVQQGVAVPHGQIRLQRYQQNVGFVPASLLVEESPRHGQVHRLAPADVPEKHDRVGDAAVRADQQALKVAVFLPQRVADLRVSIKFGGHQVRQGSLPLHGSLDRSSVLDGDDLVTGLSGRKLGRESDHEQCEQAKHVLHIHHLEKASPGADEPWYGTDGKLSYGGG